MTKLERKVNEFCVEGNLERYRTVLTEIFIEIQNSECRISTRDDGGPSIHEFQAETQCIIRIPVSKFKKDPIKAIWTILHEYGHHLSGSVTAAQLKSVVVIERERKAWRHARSFVVKHKMLSKQLDDFDIYAKECLGSYLNSSNK